MRRSEINQALNWAKDLLEANKIKLPPFAYWDLTTWKENKHKLGVIIEVMLGWDITDYGQGRFAELGAVLFTLRNGSLKNKSIGTPYAEKLILLQEGQRLPNHCHAIKTEDIINRGGGVMAIKLYNSLPNGKVDYNSPVEVDMDGIRRSFKAGEEVHIYPGESITLRPYQYHLFWAKEGAGDLILGEVSSINDDKTDNYNAEEVARFAEIIEDVSPVHPLCNEYKKLLGE